MSRGGGTRDAGDLGDLQSHPERRVDAVDAECGVWYHVWFEPVWYPTQHPDQAAVVKDVVGERMVRELLKRERDVSYRGQVAGGSSFPHWSSGDVSYDEIARV